MEIEEIATLGVAFKVYNNKIGRIYKQSFWLIDSQDYLIKISVKEKKGMTIKYND